MYNHFITNSGQFFVDNTDEPYLIYEDEDYHLSHHSIKLTAMLADIARINSVRPRGKAIIGTLRDLAFKNGHKAYSTPWQHANSTKAQVYLRFAPQSSKLVQLTPGGVTLVPNGNNVDGIFLLGSNVKPINILISTGEDHEIHGIRLLEELLVDNLVLSPANR